MRLLSILLTLAIFLIGGLSVALGQQQVNDRTFVLLVEGAGTSTTLSDNMSSVYAEMKYLGCRRPILCSVVWTAGNNLEDYLSRSVHLEGAAILLRDIHYIRQRSPASRIVLISYSAGASVLLAAAEQLPPATVDRIILLGPTVASNRDLRPALRASKMGVNVFYVPGDPFLQWVQDMWGAPYGRPGSTVASMTGFQIPNSRQAPDPIYSKLRQYPMPGLPWHHFGTAKPDFLRTYVVPMIP